jgi:hypothetical protein
MLFSPLTPGHCQRAAVIATVAAALAVWAGPAAGSAVYKWLDDAGVVHLSSEKPPAGVKYERLAIASGKGASARDSGAARSSGTRVSAATTAQRTEMLGALRNRECVIALEALDKLTGSGGLVEPAEMRRLEQTANLNCSPDPVRRGAQEEMAARLRVAKSDVCVDARNKLAAMLEPGGRPTRERLQTQQEFIEAHCTLPVR